MQRYPADLVVNNYNNIPIFFSQIAAYSDLMIKIRYSDERGKADFGWLQSFHTFSFGNYFDRRHMHFGPLRVINEDFVMPGKGFGTHPHDNMEIITYILDGALEHKDSMGSGSIIRPGDIQRMSAGTGVTHSEFNPSQDESVHLLQIWILPAKENINPSYAQKHFPEDERHNRLTLLASQSGRDGSLSLCQDTDLYTSALQSGHVLRFEPKQQRQQWVQVAKGEVYLNNQVLKAGDGAAIEDENILTFEKANKAEFLLFDMAKYE